MATVWQSQPLHVLYGGAHLFRNGTVKKLGDLARAAMAENDLGAALGVPPEIVRKVEEKLAREPIEDYRVDFEDGYGVRPDEEEDNAAVTVARELVGAEFPRYFGIRIKAGERGVRTLELFLDNVETLPKRFIVTLPKVTSAWEVSSLMEVLRDRHAIRIEIMAETPGAILNLPELVDAAKGHCSGVHFGAYDYLASLGIAQPELKHPACDFARSMMLASLAGKGVWLSDGATNILPLRGTNVAAAWKLHYDNTLRSLYNGFFQGWDLHPAQIPARLAAVYMFFLEGLPAATERLRNFVDKAALATHVEGVFDDAATGRGLLNYFRRALACGLAEDVRPVVLQLEKLLETNAGDD